MKILISWEESKQGKAHLQGGWEVKKKTNKTHTVALSIMYGQGVLLPAGQV